MKVNNKVYTIAIIFLTIVFSYSLFEKVMNIDVFTVSLIKSPLVNNVYVPYLRYLIPALEFILVIFLVFFYNSKIGAHLSLFLSILFTVYLIAFYQVTGTSGCGCGRLIESLSYLYHLCFINIPLIVFSIILVLRKSR